MTQHNAIVRKLGDKCVVMYVVSSDEFESLFKHSENEDPTMLMGAVTKNDFGSAFLPQTIFNTREPRDISKETEGQTINQIACDEWWVVKKVKNPFDALYGGK